MSPNANNVYSGQKPQTAGITKGGDCGTYPYHVPHPL